MQDLPERPLDPPEHWTCQECLSHFYPIFGDEPEDDEPSLCCDCKTFDG